VSLQAPGDSPSAQDLEQINAGPGGGASIPFLTPIVNEPVQSLVIIALAVDQTFGKGLDLLRGGDIPI
jgi:hypothetical protein